MHSTVKLSRSIATVDVEDYFQVEAFSRAVDRRTWRHFPSRVVDNTNRVLDLFDELHVTGTFFVLGWVAEEHPRLIRRIACSGHELACHSYWHHLVYELTSDQFRRDTRRAKDAIEQAAGVPVSGYRAPSFSITPRCTWAFEVLAELGFLYDSSVFPIKHDVYGFSNAPRIPFRLDTPSGPILEFPMTTFRLPGLPQLPVAGGGYLRILPDWYTRAGVRRAWREGLTVVSYVHPWELDPDQPHLKSPLRSRFRHYTNLAKTAKKLRALLALDRFTSFRDSGLVSVKITTGMETASA